MIWAVQVPIRCTATSVWATYFRKGPPQYPMTSWYWVALLRFPDASYQVPTHVEWFEAAATSLKLKVLILGSAVRCALIA